MTDDITPIKLDIVKITEQLKNTSDAVEKITAGIDDISNQIRDIQIKVVKIDAHIDTESKINKTIIGIFLAVVGVLLKHFFFGST